MKSPLEIVHNLAKENLLKISWNIVVCNENEYSKKQYTSKEKNITKVFFEIPITTNESLLVYEKPSTIFSNMGVVLGENADILKCKFEKDKKSYYVNKVDLSKLTKTIISKEKVPKQYLFHKKISLTTHIEKINSAKEFAKKHSAIDFEIIQKGIGKRIRIFNPFENNRDLQLAKRIHLPLFQITKNNFFLETTTHVQDEESIINILQPFEMLKEKGKINIDKNTGLELYSDLRQKIILNIDKEKIKEKIKNLKHYNFSLEKFINFLFSKEEIIIANQYGSCLMPLWFKGDKILTFQNENSFFEKAGVKFKNNKEFMEKIFLVNNKGDEVTFGNFYFDKKFETCFENNHNKEKSYIILLKLLSENSDSIIINENISKEIFELEKQLKGCSEKIVLQSIKLNAIPKKTTATSALSKTILSKVSNIFIELEEFEKHPNKKVLLHNIKLFCIFLKKTLNKFSKQITLEELFYYYQSLLLIIKTLKLCQSDLGKEIESLLEEYFGVGKLIIFKSKINKSQEKIIEDSLFIQNNYKKLNIKVFFKNEIKKEIKEYLPLEIKEIASLNNYDKEYRGNKFLLKKYFPKSYNKIVKEFNGKTLPKSLVWNNKKIKIIKDFYLEYWENEEYKQIHNNNEFITFGKKINK